MKFYETLPGITPRVERLKEQLHHVTPNIPETVDMFRVPGYANSSFMKRRAMQVQEMLATLPVRILPGEMIVGSLLGLLPKMISETYEERKTWANISLAFPARNTVYGTQDYTPVNRELSEEELHDEERGRWNWGHSCLGLPNILKKGYLGMAAEAQAKIDEMNESGCVDKDKIEFWECVILCCQAVVDFAGRYADEAARQAAAETDAVRKAELLAVEACVRHAPAYPAANFHEALQAAWFAFLTQHIFLPPDMGRFDQAIYPFYKKDVEEGSLTAEKAQELMDCLWVKFYEDRVRIPVNAGLSPSIMLAGVDAQGKDATNEVTYMAMTATRHVGSPTPKLSVRVNDQTPAELYELAHIMLTGGLMMPDFYNEKAVIGAYERIGVPFEDAINFAQSVCEEISLAGISEECTNEGPHVDLHDMVMYALRQSAADETDFDTVLARVEAKICATVKSEVDFHLEQTRKLQHYLPQPLHSASIEGCIESGKDIMYGGARYNNTGSVLGGIATASNSLYAVKRLVYDEKRMTLAELMEILDKDYEGHEALRAEILSKFPKYGNDVDEVDTFAVFMYDIFTRELEKYRNSRGGLFKIGAWASEYRSNYQATPDGRKRFDSFAVNVSPTPGTDQKGATAVIRSTTKLALDKCTAGGMVDVTLAPSVLKGPNGVEVLRNLVETYCQLGGSGIQFNFVDSAMLEAALADPVKYKNLMVRVWGYNDYYVALTEERKKHILDRTKHEEGL